MRFGDPCLDRFSRLLGQFKLDGLPRLLLHDGGPGNDPTAMSDITYLEFDEIAAPKFAVNRQIEKGKVSGALVLGQFEPYLGAAPPTTKHRPWRTAQQRA